jgi:hypothetical protein
MGNGNIGIALRKANILFHQDNDLPFVLLVDLVTKGINLVTNSITYGLRDVPRTLKHLNKNDILLRHPKFR